MSSGSHRYLNIPDPTHLRQDMGQSPQESQWPSLQIANYWILRLFRRWLYSVPAHKLMCTGPNMCTEMTGMSPWSHKYLNCPDLTQLSQDMGQAHKNTVCMHTILYIQVEICAQKCQACLHVLIDTSITLIWHYLTQIWVQAHKNTVCMHTRLHAQVSICAQKWPACPPGLIDTSIALI